MKEKIKISKLIGAFLVLSMMALTTFGINMNTAHAAVTPSLALTSTGDGDSVQVNVVGDPNSSVILYYNKTNVGQSVSGLGSTNASGTLSTVISTSSYGVVSGTYVYVGVDGLNSTQMAWPVNSTAGTFSLSQTSAVLAIGQSTTITANNANGLIYLSNNSNPPVANLSINGTQITINATSSGSTTASLCLVNNTSTCASVYITVGSNSSSALTFSVSTVTVSPSQSVPITISGGNGSYTVLNNSNSSAIQTNISGSTITLSTNATSGTAAITVCSSDMNACGIINATAGSASTTPLTFSQTNPNLSIGQTLNISLSGGSSTTYYVSNNSNSNYIQATINGNNLALVGLATGTSNITVCSSSGNCGTENVVVNFTSTGGTLALSENTVSLLVGMILSVTVSGGMTPYNVVNPSSGVVQTSLNGGILTLSGISTGSASINVCSAGSNCVLLQVTVSSSGTSNPIIFSPSSVSVAVGGTSTVTISGAGGYYVSNSTNSSFASAVISGNTATITGLIQGNENISVCESGGQCAILFVSVGTGTTNTLPSFSPSSVSVAVGQNSNVFISGGTGSGYYLSANSNPSVATAALIGNMATVTGIVSGTTTLTICSASTSCSSLPVTVGSASAITFTSTTLPDAVVGQVYSEQLSANGGSGNYTYTVSSGGLPSGLILSSSGLITGTPVASGYSTFTITVADTSGNTVTSGSLTLTIDSSSGVTVPSTPTTPTTPTAATYPYPSGQLINYKGTIYIVYQNMITGFAGPNTFKGLGYAFANVVNASDISSFTNSGKIYKTLTVPHPWGAWITNGKTVYFVSKDGLIGVPSWSIFLNNGGKSSYLVPANKYDLALPVLPIMTTGDSRVE